eukprot:g12779.t1
MERGSLPLPPRKPPRLPHRPAAELGVAVGKASSVSHQDLIPPRSSPQPVDHNEEDSCLDLAKLMLSDEGLAMKKVTVEGFTIPVVLRLVDRRRPQQHGKQLQQSMSETTAEAEAEAAAALAITWVDHDNFGFDLRGLFVRRGEDCVEGGCPPGRTAAGRKRGRGVGSGDWCIGAGTGSHMLVLSWSMGSGSAEVVLEAASRNQRELLAVTLDTLISGLERGDGSDPASQLARAGSYGAGGVDDRSYTAALRRDLAASRSSSDGGSAVLEPSPPRATDIYDNDGSDEDEVAADTAAAARMLAEFDEAAAAAAEAAADAADMGSRRTTLAPHETDDKPATHGDGGGLPFSFPNGTTSFARDAAVTHPQVHRKASKQRSGGRGGGGRGGGGRDGGGRGGFVRRGVSFSPGRASGGVPVLARSRTTGTVIGRESEAALQQQEEEQQARLRRQEAMMRLLAVYDRARDESQAAAWRLGAMKLKRLLSGAATRQMEGCWARWCGAVRRANYERQKADRRLWFLHAKANQNNDLLAWYHATFCREVYRRRVPFWFRETKLMSYQKAYRIVDDEDAKYTPMERSLMTSCVCTMGTKYADVAAQLFTAKGVLSAEEYRVFQTLVKRGAEVPKANPKTGKRFPHPMKLRLWFNRGALCLTAKRDKPDGAASKDHSFYLSKVKTCVVSLPSTRRGSRSSNSDGVPTPTSVGGYATGFGTQAVDSGVLAPSPANAIFSGVDNVGGRRGSASSFFSAAPVSSPPPSPSPLPDAASHGASGFAHDEADRGAGGGGGTGGSGGAASKEGPSGRSVVVIPSNDAVVSGAGVMEGPASPGPRHRVLSMHFFGRSITLDLWFAGEVEAVEWQGMLTKLSWKEQGYLYRGPPGDAGSGEEDTLAAEEQQEGDRGGAAAHPAALEAGRGRDGAENGPGGGGGRDAMRAQTISPVAVAAPSPSSSSSSPSIVTSEWEHATHGGPPPPPLSWKEQGYLYRGPPGDAGSGEEDTLAAEEQQEGDRGGAAAHPAALEAGRGRDGAENGPGGGGGRDAMRAQTISPVAVAAPSPSSSSSSPSIVTSEWEHATHGGPPPPPVQPPPPCVR